MTEKKTTKKRTSRKTRKPATEKVRRKDKDGAGELSPFSFIVSEAEVAYKPDGDATSAETVYFDPDAGVKLIQGNSIDVMSAAPSECVDMIFADPPYFLSNNGITCHAGRMVSVNKGKWDQSKGAEADHQFVLDWLSECRRLLRPNGTIWVSGTLHVIYSVGYAMQQLGYKILNDIVWVKPNPPPHLACRYFTHSTEIVLWARKSERAKHYFNYALMKRLNHGKQMKNVWSFKSPNNHEKRYGKHPTQKPTDLLDRIILSSTEPGMLVLDPFAGSGTTGVSCVNNGRRFVGIDIESDYLQVAEKRIKDALADSKNHLFAE
jgi:site-specific DNA-methyltransferase (adenine-specific)